MSTVFTAAVPDGIVQVTDSRGSAGELAKKSNGSVDLSKLNGLRYFVDGIPRSWTGKHTVVSFTATSQPPTFYQDAARHLEPHAGDLAGDVRKAVSELLHQYEGVSATVSGYDRERVPCIWRVARGATLINKDGEPYLYVSSYDFLFKRLLGDVLVPKRRGIPMNQEQPYLHLQPQLDPASMSIQDAIELGRWYVRSTEMLERLSGRGTFSGVGGPAMVTVITRDGAHTTTLPTFHYEAA